MASRPDPGASPAHAVEAVELVKVFSAPRSLGSLLARTPAETLTAVDRVSFGVRAGEVFGLVGPNGAGKTTLIKLLTSLLTPTSGSARIWGYDTRRQDLQVRRRIGLVTSNERSFFWRLTGLQNLEFFASLYHIPDREARARIAELVEVLDLGAFAGGRFDTYSTGTRQRFALARGLLIQPRVLFMDEPTKGVDPSAAAQILEVIRERVLRRWSPTVVITSHNLHEIERLCERVAIMSRGRIVALGSIDELRRMEKASETYRLTVRKLGAERLRQLLASQGVEEPSVEPVDGACDLEFQIGPRAEGLPPLIRALVEAGGDIEQCTRIELPFDRVFLSILSRSAPARVARESGGGA